MSLHRDYFRCVTPPPPQALRVELMSLISEVCSVVREAKNSPGSSSFCAAERLTFRCRPLLTWMEVKKHLTAQLCETFARNGSNSESFCTGAASRSNPDLLWFSGEVSSPFVLVISGFCCSFRLNTTNNQQGEMLRLKAVRAASCGLPFRSFAQPKLAHTPHHPWRNYRLWLHAKIETRGGLLRTKQESNLNSFRNNSSPAYVHIGTYVTCPRWHSRSIGDAKNVSCVGIIKMKW